MRAPGRSLSTATAGRHEHAARAGCSSRRESWASVRAGARCSCSEPERAHGSRASPSRARSPEPSKSNITARSPGPSKSNLTRPRGAQMTREDRSHPPERVAIVLWAAQMGAVTAEALAIREQAGLASARGRLQAAARAGLLTRHRPLAEHPALFSATAAGLRVAGARGLQPARVSAANARHTIVCAQVAAALERLYPSHTVMGERELR